MAVNQNEGMNSDPYDDTSYGFTGAHQNDWEDIVDPFGIPLGENPMLPTLRPRWGSDIPEAFDRTLASLGSKTWLNRNTYQPDQAAWQYGQGFGSLDPSYQNQVLAAKGLGNQDPYTAAARAAQSGARGEQANALAMLRDYATGGQSIARQQGALERDALANRIAGQVAGRPYDPAAMRGGQMALASGSADLGAKTAIAAAQEKLAAQQALMQGAGQMRGADISQFGQESALEKSLRDYQTQKDTMARQWWQMGLGEKAAGMANEQDWEKTQAARDQYLMNQAARFAMGPEASQGIDWAGLIGGATSAFGGLAGGLAGSLDDLIKSDERAKTGIVPSGEQCKQALASANAPLAQFLGSQPSRTIAAPAPSPQPSRTIAAPAPSPLIAPQPLVTEPLRSLYEPGPLSTVSAPTAAPSWSPRDVQPISQPTEQPYLPAPEGWIAPGYDPNAPTPYSPSRVAAPLISSVPTPKAESMAAAKIAQPGVVSPYERAEGKYGHELHPWSTGENSTISPAALDTSADFSLPFGTGEAATSGGGSWQQTAPPSGGGSWSQSQPMAAQQSPAQKTAAAPSPMWSLPAAQQPAAVPLQLPQQQQNRVSAIPEPMPKPVGLGVFNGLIFSDERCKILDEQVKRLESEGRGLTPEAAFARARLDKMRAEAGESMGASGGGADAGPGVGDLSVAQPELAAAPAQETINPAFSVGGVPASSGAGPAAEAKNPMAGNMMGALDGVGKGLGAVLGALMPKPTRFRDSGPAQLQITPNVMGGIAQSLLSDISAKQGMQPTDQRLDEFLGEIEPTQFRYKQPFAQAYGAGKRTGVIAQDVAKSELGDDMVVKDPQSGMLMLDTTPSKFNPLVLASLAHLAHRLERVEGGK